MSQCIDSASDASNPEEDPEYLPARMLNEFVYCPRLFYLEHVDGLFTHNADTIEGVAKHRRVDQKTDELPTAESTQDYERIHARSVTLSSDSFGIIAKMDLIEVQGNLATPVDYKRGAPRKLPDGTLDAWDPERVQLCVQALVLRENGYECSEGVIFFWETRQRVRIAIDSELMEQTRKAISEANELIRRLVAPPPLVDSPKCPRCSLVSICLPDETSRCVRHDSSDTEGLRQPLLFEVGLPQVVQIDQTEVEEQKPIRQLVTVRDEAKPVYLNTQGMSVGISGQVLTIKDRDKDKKIQEIRLKDVSQLNLFGAVQVSTQAIQALLQEDIPLAYFSFGGWFHGMTQAVGLKNILWRREQFRKADQPSFCLALAKELVIGKIRNQRTMLQRNHIEPSPETLNFLKSLMIEAKRVESIASLLGVEGVAARAYFSSFSGMIKVGASRKSTGVEEPGTDAEEEMNPTEDAVALATSRDVVNPFRFDFAKRNRRPPRDPINALLSLGYGVLAKDLTVLCATVGLDPYLGFYHQPRFGRPSLALDMMEPFRPLVVDSAVISAINQRMVTTDDFISAGDAVALTPRGRKSFYLAYEQRMDQLVTHPMFGYRVSYRRLIEIQIRLLARLLTGEITRYPVFVTR
jgi:CRISPR-associated protein Cas1